MSRRSLAALLFALTAFAPAAARAQLLYSVDYGSDELVSIDPRNGQVSVVGPLGLDAFDVDLAALNGKLYAIDSHPYNYANLLEINPTTGAARVLGPITAPIGAVLNAEGLTRKGGALYAGYAVLGAHHGSNALGTIALDGTITDVFNFFNVLRDADFDGLGTGFDGALLATDNKVGFGVLLNRITAANPGSYDPLGMTFAGADACCGRGEDLDFVGLRLYYGNGADATIARVDPNNGALLAKIALTRSPVGAYAGLVSAPSASCAPLALGSWRRVCGNKDPFGEGANLAGYADDIRAYSPFANLAGAADLCNRLKPAAGDKCAQADAQFLGLLLNVDSLRLSRDCCANGGPTVTEVFAQVWALLKNPARTQADCTAAQTIADSINSGAALCP